MAYLFDSDFYDKEFNNDKGLILRTNDDVKAFKKQYKDLFNPDANNSYGVREGFKDIDVPVSEGQAVIVDIREYGHYRHVNRAAWKYYDEVLVAY